MLVVRLNVSRWSLSDKAVFVALFVLGLISIGVSLSRLIASPSN